MDSSTESSNASKKQRTSVNATAPQQDVSAADMEKYLHFPPSHFRFCTKHNEHEDKLVQLLLKVFNKVKYLLKNRDKISPKDIDDFFALVLVKEFGDIFPDIMNLGPKLTTKSHGAMLCFAIDECIDFINGNNVDPQGIYHDKMDHNELCLNYHISHTFYSHISDGGTNPETFKTNVARRLFQKFFDMWDAFPLCCEGTIDNPEGNKFSVFKKQLQKISEGRGFRGKDRMTFWWVWATLLASLRALRYYAETGKPYTLMILSIRNCKEGYENENGEKKSSDVLILLQGPHPESAISYLPNRVAHPEPSVWRYAEHASNFYAFLRGEVFEGIEIIPPTVEQSTYYPRHAEIGVYEPNPRDKAARDLVLHELYALPHLAAVFARLTKDFTLATFDVDVMNNIINSNKLSSEDTQSHEKLVAQMTPERLLAKLCKQRDSTLRAWNKLVAESTGIVELNNLNYLAAVIVRKHGNGSLANVNVNMLEGTNDTKLFETMSDKFGGDSKLSEKLEEIRNDSSNNWENSTMKELNDLNYLAAVIVRKHGNGSLANVNVNMLEGTNDTKLFETMSDKFGGNNKLSEKLIKVHNDWENNQLKELNDLKHLAAVVVNQCTADEIDFMATSTFDFRMLYNEEDYTLSVKYSVILGDDEKLLQKLKEIRQDFVESAFAEVPYSRRLALVVAQNTDVNDLTSSALNEDLFLEAADREKYKILLKKYGDEEALFHMLQPYLIKYQGKCQGIPAKGMYPAVSCVNPRGDLFSSGNPCLITGAKITKGHGLSGIRCCHTCLDAFDIGGKYNLYEVRALEQKENNNTLTTDESKRLQSIRPYKTLRQLGSSGCYWKTADVIQPSTIEIELEQCSFSHTFRVSGISSNAGRLSVGHHIFAINGIDTKTMSHDDVQRIISEQSTPNIVFGIGTVLVGENDKPYKMRDRSVVVQSEKAMIHVGKCSITNLPNVKKMSSDSEMQGQCVEGDIIIAINGEDMSNKDDKYVISVLKSTPGRKVFDILTSKE